MSDYVNEEAVKLAKVYRDIDHIRENLAKRQYLNAAAWAADMVPTILSLFGCAKRGDRP